MLQTIRDKITGWVAAIFLGAIAVVFVFWGIDFQSNSANYAVKVNGDTVAIQTVQRAWQQRLSQMQQMLRDEVPADLAKAQQAALMEQFVQQTLLTQRATEFGYQVSDVALVERIHEIPQFQADGKFSPERYNGVLAQMGYTTAQFEADLKKELLIAQVQEAVVDSAFVAPYELERRYLLEKQERQIDYALIAASSFAGQVTVTDEQIQAWYDSHKSDYQTTETVDLEYLEITRAMAEAKVSVDEKALRDYYETVKTRMESPERRRARHILITTEDGLDDAAAVKKATDLTAQAKGGANFDELAKKNSKDSGSAQQGGDLGWATRGMFVGPFEEALFSMTAGEIRGPVKTEFGYHVLKLEEIDAGHLRTFEEARPEIEAEYRKEKSQEIFTQESQQLDEKSFSALTELATVATSLNLPLQRVAGFTRQGGETFGTDPEVIKAAFSEDVLERGQNSPIIPVGEDRAVVLRISNHKPAEARPLAEIRPQIESLLRTQAMRDAAAKQGADAVARLQKGDAWSTVTADLKVAPAGPRFVTRQDQVVPPAVLRAAFDVPRAQASESKPHIAGVVTEDGNYAVWSLTAVKAPTAATEPADQKTMRQGQTERQLGNEEFAAYLKEAERTAKVSRNDKIFE
jgi:peptidyl-prolyl cis-trans isomerase D